jgi:HAE1 family hydrophobic/amphiphilic exporter-1
VSWLTKIALKKRWLTFLILILLIVASIWATVNIKQELIPDIEFPITSVVAIYPQASPEEVMDQVTKPIEDAISDIGGLEEVLSTSTEGSSFLLVQFEFGTDMDEVNGVISQKLSELALPSEMRSLPDTMPQLEENPQLFPIDINMMPLVILSLGGDIPPGELQDIAVTEIIPRLETIEGVFHVGVEGGTQNNVLVTSYPEKMSELGISVAQVVASLGTKEYYSLDEIGDTVIGMDTLALNDVADIKLGPPPGTALIRTNGTPSVSIMVMKDDEANTVEVANDIVAEVEIIRGTLGDNVELLTVLDQSQYIEESIGDLARNATIGFALAAIVVFLFLMAFRASLVTALSIPLSIIFAILIMRYVGITINILTLSALAIAVGRLIDNSIVISEVIYRRMQRGEPFMEAALSGVKEVANPITAATVATVIIFVPIIFVGGIVGEMFMPFGLTITFALVASLLVALMIVPPLSNFKVARKVETGRSDSWYQRIYSAMLRWSLAHRVLVLVIAIVLFFGSFTLLPIIGTSFIPSMGEKMLTVDVEMPPGTDLITTEEATIHVEELLDKNPEVLTYQTAVGTSSSLVGGFSALRGGGTNTASITVLLNPESNLEQEAAELRQAYEALAKEADVTVSTGNATMSGASTSGLAITVRGENLEDITDATNRLITELDDVEGLVNIETELMSVEPKLSIQPDMSKLLTSGLPIEQLPQLQQEFDLMIRGGTVAKATLNGKTHEVFLGEIMGGLDNVEIAGKLRVGWPKSVALGDIATVQFTDQMTNLRRIDQKLAARIGASITEEKMGAVNRVVQGKIDALSVAPGVEVKIGGVAEEMRETFSGMFIAIAVAIVLAYAVLVVSFRSFLNPFIVMISLPLASIGALLGLLIAGQPLGASGMMGMLMLVGIVLTNAIVLITYVEQLRKDGVSSHDALVEAGRVRLRPILMTALTTMVAMLPLALGLGEGTVMSAELAVVVIGGLFTSTILTLLVIPVIYSLFSRVRRGD